jgi:HD superfamily phosphodiesterase
VEDVYEAIYALAEPYWQTRSNEIHVPQSYGFARELIAACPEAEEEIVLPAVLLHDIGYALVPEETHTQGLADGPADWNPDITRMHETLGAQLAGELLAQVGYDPERTKRIQEIVDGHDSRVDALSIEDAVVKDADKAWRYSESAAQICPSWFGLSADDYLDYVESKLGAWFLTDAGRELAAGLLERSRALVASESS